MDVLQNQVNKYNDLSRRHIVAQSIVSDFAPELFGKPFVQRIGFLRIPTATPSKAELQSHLDATISFLQSAFRLINQTGKSSVGLLLNLSFASTLTGVDDLLTRAEVRLRAAESGIIRVRDYAAQISPKLATLVATSRRRAEGLAAGTSAIQSPILAGRAAMSKEFNRRAGQLVSIPVKLGEGIVSGAEGAADIFRFFGRNLPMLLVLAVVVFVLIYFVGRRK